ncbi:MAG: PKD domain-containing protein [Candidatus Thorarchaeota archaeon]
MSRIRSALLRDTKRSGIAIAIIVIVIGSSFGIFYFLPRGAGPMGGDNDGMPDSWEMLYGLDMNDPNDAQLDKDGDGLTNLEEYQYGTNPTLVDTDSDGLWDNEEVTLGTDPTYYDSDNDTLSDGEEVKVFYTDPLDPDSDAEGLDDGTEVNTVGTDPNDQDTDNDMLTDWEEYVQLGTDPLLNDTDQDALKDWDELYIYGTDPTLNDTDFDILLDGEEVQYGTDPLDMDSEDDGLNDGSEPDWNVDTDGDSLINALDPDSDNDLLLDGDEILLGADPLDNDSDDDNVIDGWDPAPIDSDADDDGITDGNEATTWAYWYETEDLDLEQGVLGNDPDARNGRAVFSSGPGMVFNSSVPSSEADYKFFVRARSQFPESANRSIMLSIEQDGVMVVNSDMHLLTAIYRWYSTPFFNVSSGQLQMIVNASHPWVVIDRVAIIRMYSINSELTDPLDQDTDGDAIIEGRESVLNSYWYEVEDFAWSPTQIFDNVNASNSKHVNPLPDGRVAFISDPSFVFPNGTYVVFVRALSTSLNTSNTMEVDITLGGDPVTVPPVQYALVRQVVYGVIVRDVNLYEWAFALKFDLLQEDTIDIELRALGELNDIFVDKVLLMKLDYFSDTQFVSYDNGTVIVSSWLNVPRGISDPMDIDTDGDGYRADDGFAPGSSGWFTDGFEVNDIGTNPFDIDTDRDGDADTVDPNPNSGDTDKDGIFDYIELLSNYNGTQTDPLNPDTDGDYIRDGDEDLNLDGSLTAGETNPTVADTDKDGIPDGIEIGISDPNTVPVGPPIITDPLNPDTDGDTLLDGIEDANANGQFEPSLNETRADRPDTDFDALADNEELAYSTDPNNPDSDADWLLDGLEVYLYGTNATKSDTDEEGLIDGMEVNRYYTDPLLPDTDFDNLTDWEEVYLYRTNPLSNDTDQEGLYDDEEVNTYGTDPNHPDTDRDGVSDYDEVQAGTNPLNAPPVARIGLARDAYRNLVAHFFGTKSYDKDGEVVGYGWSFGDGTFAVEAKPTHTYSQTGEYDVTLIVTDDDGETGSTTITVTVLNQLPIAEAGMDQEVFTGSRVNFAATPGSTDPDGSIVSYDWDFMDGDTGSGATTSHVFQRQGTYYVTLTVTDNDGGKDTDTVVIIAQVPKPPDLLVAPENVSFSTDGELVFLTMTVENRGDVDSNDLSFQIRDLTVTYGFGHFHSSGLQAHTSIDFTIPLADRPVGSHILSIEIDHNHRVDEADEENNNLIVTVPDADGDSRSDVMEDFYGTDKNAADSDADGLFDGPLVIGGFFASQVEKDWNIDSDGDGLINAIDVDSDNDSYFDGEDIDPLHDLLVKVQIYRFEVEDPIDVELVIKTKTIRVPYFVVHWWGLEIKYESLTIEYPALEGNRNAEPFFRVYAQDQWSTGNWMNSEVPVAYDISTYSSNDSPLFVSNVPDNQPTVWVDVQAWDVDLEFDDQLDLARIGKTATTGFNLREAAAYQPGDYQQWAHSSGSDDGSTSRDTDDAYIRFYVYHDYELSYQEQMALAEKFSPQLYIDVLETWYPRDIRDFLDHAILMDFFGIPQDLDPTPAELEAYAGTNSYLDLNPLYHVQDSSTYGLKFYAHVFTSYNDYIVIQYWFFYLYDLWVNQHEGDWEMIQLILPPQGSQDVDALVPLDAGYSWHNHIKKSGWFIGDLSKEATNHPVVYVGLGGHASRFTPLGSYNRQDMSQYSMELLVNQGWLKFDGLWGQRSVKVGESGPPGPVFRSGWVLYPSHFIATFILYHAYMWTDPYFWYEYTTVVV